MTDAERMQRVEELFHRAVALPLAEQAARLASWCEPPGGDEALQAEVLELLQAERQLDAAIATAPAIAGTDSQSITDEDQWEGRLVGKYRLLRLLGRGGMGVVYLAERAGQDSGSRAQDSEDDGSDSGVREDGGQRVAIKFVRRTLRGSPAVAHFLLERQTLAALQHPNIARLLDGGITGDDAVPYVVMEFVEGQRLDAVCDAPGTGARAVVELMLQLCEAVGFAHRNLVLHRDLKPGNVMVSSEGAVKLLDFGTLKMLGEDAAPSAMTQAGMRPVTLRYAAPEHVLGGAAVSTATDVYSLGMMLYRLLAGRLPPELETLSLPEWFEHLKNRAVTPPSVGAKESAERVTPKELAGDLDASDLDAIALKAMRYEPEARYPSAQTMAEDLRRALAGQPVLAREGSRRYRLSKLYRRNRAVFWAGAAAAGVLLAGSLAMRRETRIALAQEHVASAGVEQERVLAHTLLFDYFTQLQQIPGSTDAQRQAVTEANTYLDTLAATNPSPDLTLETVRGYTAMGTLLGSPYYQNLGDVPGALRTLNKALPIAQTLVRNEPRNLQFQQALAATHMALGQVELGSGKPKEAVENFQAASGPYLALAERPGADIKAIIAATNLLNNLGDAYSQRGNGALRDPEKAIAIFNRVLMLYRGCEPLDPSGVRCSRGIAIAYTKLGQLYEDTDVVQARNYYNQALTWLQGLPAADQAKTPVQRSYGILRVRLIVLNAYENRMDIAQPMINQERGIDQHAIAADPMDARALFDLAALDASLMDAFFSIKDHRGALSSSRYYLETANKLVALQPNNPSWAYLKAQATLQYGRALLETGDGDAGEREASRGLEMILPMAEAPDAEPDTLNTAAQYLVYFHRDAPREGPLAVGFVQRSLATAGAPSSDDLLLLGQTQRYAGQAEASHESARGALKLLDREPNSMGHAADVAEARALLAQ